MTCNEVLELISAEIDGELEQHHKPQLMHHINECRSCQNEYELERMTKNLIHQAVAPAKATPAVIAAVKQNIEHENQPAIAKRLQGLLRTVFGSSPRRGMLALGGAAVILLLFFIFSPSKSHHSHAQPSDANIIHQTFNNFDRVLNGSFVPEITTSDPNEARAFFSKCGCKMKVPALKKASFVAVQHSFYNEEHVAQLVYKLGNDVIYLYEAKLQDVIEGNKLQLAPEIMEELQRTGWYMKNYKSDCSLVIWLVDSTICCAVADIKQEQLLASLR